MKSVLYILAVVFVFAGCESLADSLVPVDNHNGAEIVQDGYWDRNSQDSAFKEIERFSTTQSDTSGWEHPPEKHN